MLTSVSPKFCTFAAFKYLNKPTSFVAVLLMNKWDIVCPRPSNTPVKLLPVRSLLRAMGKKPLPVFQVEVTDASISAPNT